MKVLASALTYLALGLVIGSGMSEPFALGAGMVLLTVGLFVELRRAPDPATTYSRRPEPPRWMLIALAVTTAATAVLVAATALDLFIKAVVL